MSYHKEYFFFFFFTSFALLACLPENEVLPDLFEFQTVNLIQLIKELSSGNEKQLDLEAVNFLSVSLSL